MDRQDYVIEVSHVSKSFKDNKVLKDVSLLCESGKIYGLVGHNGSGKTVLFKSICGFLSILYHTHSNFAMQIFEFLLTK